MDQQKPFIIVVDEDEESRYLLNHSFAELGMEANVKFFGDALQFIRYTELIASLNVKPSLIILDYKMPYMSGKAVVSYLKESSPFREIPVVTLSGPLPAETEERLFGLGITACYLRGDSQESLTVELREILKLALPVDEGGN
jgi:CheY-like chemotaxis protein